MVGLMLPFLALFSSGEEAPNLVTVTGTATQTLAADQATVDMVAKATAADRAAAGTTAKAERDRALALTRSLLSPGKAPIFLDTSAAAEYSSVGASGPPALGEPRLKVYTAYGAFSLSGLELGKVDLIAQKLAALSDVTATVSHYDVRDEAGTRKAVLHQAFENARTKAEEAATAAGLHLGDVYTRNG